MKFNQRGAIGAGLAVALGFIGLIVAIAVICFASYVSASNRGNALENGVVATYENLSNVLGNYTLKVQEMAAVPDMYKDNLKEVMAGVMTARMGADGSKAVVQWFKEANIPFDSSLYGKLQQTIEAGRNEFQTAQTGFIDKKRVYNTELGTFWGGMWLHMAGYPKIDLSKFKIVTAGDTKKAFETGVQAPVLQRK